MTSSSLKIVSYPYVIEHFVADIASKVAEAPDDIAAAEPALGRFFVSTAKDMARALTDWMCANGIVCASLADKKE